jgi:hypothetical protein
MIITEVDEKFIFHRTLRYYDVRKNDSGIIQDFCEIAIGLGTCWAGLFEYCAASGCERAF